MSVWETVIGVALLATGIAVVTGLTERLIPTQATRLTKLRALLNRARQVQARGDWDQAESLCRQNVELAERWFGADTRHATEAWYELIVVARRARRDETVAEATPHVIRCAGEHPGYAWFAARGREELARARAYSGALAEARTLLDEAEAIRRAHIPETLADNLEMRARVAFLGDDLPGATRVFESLLAALDGAEPGEGPYRSRSDGTTRTLQLEPAYVEEVLSSYARVLYLQDLDADAERVVARLVARAKQAGVIDARTPAMRVHAAAHRLASHGLFDGPRALALAGADQAGPVNALQMKIDAASWAWHGGDWRATGDILSSIGDAGLDAAARAERFGALAFLSYSLGSHEEGERSLREARSLNPSFAPSPGLVVARASSTFGHGDHAEAAAIVEAGLLSPSASVIQRVVAAQWALDRSVQPLANRAVASLTAEGESSSTLEETFWRALTLSTHAARRGEIDRAEEVLAELCVPRGLRYRRALLDEQVGWLMSMRGRRTEARRLLSRAWSLYATTMSARSRLGAWVAMAEKLDTPAGEAAPDHHVAQAIAARLPEVDPTLRFWWHYQASRRLRSGDLEGALALCDKARALDLRWFGGKGLFACAITTLRSDVLLEMGARGEALEEARGALANLVAHHAEDHPLVAAAERHLAGFVAGPERRALLERALTSMRPHEPDDLAEVEAEIAALPR